MCYRLPIFDTHTENCRKALVNSSFSFAKNEPLAAQSLHGLPASDTAQHSLGLTRGLTQYDALDDQQLTSLLTAAHKHSPLIPLDIRSLVLFLS
ncbi:hypothetical protein cyc_03139 [Cyclospora cayetanensis]|uniref:Uncharacterized protein n=1 Tax=Cyclospora cayetanensis TaxID=88456 RepID=A0A1D3CTG6_9EIME|nr:hypothetical protein cyc_03139 [Cyclospora cayetanensis]